MRARASWGRRASARLRSLLSGVGRVSRRSSMGFGVALVTAGSLVTLSAGTASGQSSPEYPYAVGAVGTNGAMWVQTPQLGAGWHSLGGQLIAAPALAAFQSGGSVDSPLFVANGTDHDLWIRNLTSNWQAVTSASTYCVDSPAAYLTGTAQLTVACEGSDHALWTATVGLTSNGLPNGSFSGWTSLGGDLAAGPAIASGSSLTYFAVNPSSQVFYNEGSGWQATSWYCNPDDHLAAGDAQAGEVLVLGCNADGEMWASEWYSPMSRGGAIISGPGVAVDETGVLFCLAEGTDGAVWVKQPPSGTWTSLGGQVVGGVAAVGLN
jgi:hypothetical protein